MRQSMCWKSPLAMRGAENTSCVAWRQNGIAPIPMVPTKQDGHGIAVAAPIFLEDSGSTHVQMHELLINVNIAQSFMFKAVE